MGKYNDYVKSSLDNYFDQEGELLELAEMDDAGLDELSEKVPESNFLQSEDIHREKREISARLLAYRKNNGLGSIGRLAKAAGVKESAVRKILDAAMVPYETWEKVKQGLDKLESG